MLRMFLLCVAPVLGVAQPADSFGLTSKLRFHAESLYSPWSIAGSTAYAGILGTPEEWGQGGGAYGKRFASTVGCSGIHAVLAFGLDSTLHQVGFDFASKLGAEFLPDLKRKILRRKPVLAPNDLRRGRP